MEINCNNHLKIKQTGRKHQASSVSCLVALIFVVVLWSLLDVSTASACEKKLHGDNTGQHSEPDHLWGYLDKFGRTAIPAKFALAYPFHGDYAVVELLEDWKNYRKPQVLIDRTGRVVSKKFSNFRHSLDTKTWAFKYSDGWYISQPNGQPIYGPFDGCQALSNKYCFMTIGGCTSLLESGKLVKQLPRIQQVIANGTGQLLVAVTKHGRGYIDTTGKFVISPIYREVYDFHDDLALVMLFPDKHSQAAKFNSHRFTYITPAGNRAFASKFHFGTDFKGGYAAVSILEKDDKESWGIIDKKGVWVLGPTYKHITIGKNGIAILRRASGLEQLYDCSLQAFGKTAKSFRYLGNDLYEVAEIGKGDSTSIFLQKGFANSQEVKPSTQLADKVGLIPESSPEALIPFSRAEDGRIKYGWLDESGNIKIQPVYSYGGNFSDGLAPFSIRLGDQQTN